MHLKTPAGFSWIFLLAGAVFLLDGAANWKKGKRAEAGKAWLIGGVLIVIGVAWWGSDLRF